MKVFAILCFLLAVLAVIAALFTVVVNEHTLEEIESREKGLKLQIENLREAIRLHITDKDLHKTKQHETGTTD